VGDVAGPANVVFRDFSNVVSTLTIFITWSVPMIYPYSKVFDRFGSLAQYYLCNPIAEAVLLFQRCFWTGATPDPHYEETMNLPANLFAWGWAQVFMGLVILAWAQLVFTRLENKFAERL
jgi:ABC-2 type transport system permease protein